MFRLILGIVFILLGIRFVYLAFLLKKSKDINLIKNNMVKVERIKDKEGYLKFNFKINMIFGITLCVNGIVSILSEFFVFFYDICSIINSIACLIIIICGCMNIYKAPKFQE